jgi:hypothetical protein
MPTAIFARSKWIKRGSDVQVFGGDHFTGILDTKNHRFRATGCAHGKIPLALEVFE